MTHPSRDKGNRFERELVKLARDSGLRAERAYGSNGEALGCVSSVDCLIEKWRIQAKRRRALPNYLQIPDGCDAVVFRQNHGEPMTLITYYDFLDLLRDAE